ncbi:hypothetical protein [Candidatus Harpocratesius sp.]
MNNATLTYFLVFSSILCIFLLFPVIAIIKKQSYYQFSIYIIRIISVCIEYFGIRQSILYIIPILATVIFLMNYLSIDISLQLRMNPLVRKNKMINFVKLSGSDNFEDM